MLNIVTNSISFMFVLRLIIRKSFNEIPPRVEYSLTKTGKELEPLFNKLEEWVDLNYLKN